MRSGERSLLSAARTAAVLAFVAARA